MPEATNTGVINPYAVAELIAARAIDWNRIADPQGTVAKILNIDADKLFDSEKAFLRPAVKIEQDGRLTLLRRDIALNELNSFLNLRALPASDVVLEGGLRIRRDMIASLPALMSSSVIGIADVGTSNEWNPPDKEWWDMGDYFEDVTELNDPIQGALGDCYFIAALASVAFTRPYAIINATRPSALGNEENPYHLICFYKDGACGAKQCVEVKEEVPVAKGTHQWIYARSKDKGEIWPAVMEKAYAKWRTGNTTDRPDYTPLTGGSAVMACAQLICGTIQHKSNAAESADSLWLFIRTHCNRAGKTINPMVAGTYAPPDYPPPAGVNYQAANVIGWHAYSIFGWETYNNEKYVILRNPWGTHHATLDTRPGTWMGIPLNQDGVFSMKISTFKKYFAGTGAVAA